MVTLLVHHRVADYDAWLSVYQRVMYGPGGERGADASALART